jgi:hypothetical protein
MALRGALVCESMCRGGGPAPQLLGLEGVPFDHSKRTAEMTQCKICPEHIFDERTKSQ